MSERDRRVRLLHNPPQELTGPGWYIVAREPVAGRPLNGLTLSALRTTIHIFALLLLVASSGCATLFGGWHSESYFDQLAYDHADPETLRADLERTADYVKSLGLAAPEAPSGTYPVTEMMLIRDKGDKHHVTVRLRGSARLDKPGWVLVVRVESYSWDEEGTIAAGKDLLKKIGAWHAAGAGGG